MSSVPRRPGKQPCRFYLRTGKCDYGDKCRYDHPPTSENNWRRGCTAPGSPRSVVVRDPMITFRGIVRSDPETWTERQKRRFLQAASGICQGEDALELLNLFNNNTSTGLQILHATLRSRKISHCADFTSGEVSLQRVVIPLLHVITSRKVMYNQYNMLSNPLYSIVGDDLDWESFKSSLTALVIQQKVEDSIHKDREDIEAENWSPKTYADVLAPTIALCSQLLQRFEFSHLPKVNSIMEVLIEGCTKSKELHESNANHISEEVEKLTRLVVSKMESIDRGNKFKEIQKKKVALKKKPDLLSRQQVALRNYSDPPGERNPEGPRHDNDHADIKYIQIEPTQEEALCPLHPYLLMNGAPSRMNACVEDAIEAHREVHFRLLRHDLISEICISAQQLKAVGGIKSLSKKAMFAAKRGDPGQSQDSINTHVYRNVSIEKMLFIKNSGISYEIEFDTPSFLEKQSRMQRRAWWERSKRLQHGTLCCLWKEDPQKNPRLIFGVISDRNAEDLSKSRSKIALRMPSEPYNEAMIAAACGIQAKAHETQFNSEQILLQAGPSYFAYEHVLRALKNVQIPLADCLLASRLNRESFNRERIHAGIPAYMERNYSAVSQRYNLSFLVEDYPRHKERRNERNIRQISSFDITDPDDFPGFELEIETTLDRAQTDALKAGLTRKVAIIQGPPGTGKTFLGIQIVRAILGNWTPGEEILPVLCVCFTNHALDQFLEGIMDKGVDEDDIIRVGGRSKNDRMSRINLRNSPHRKENRIQYSLRKQWTEKLVEIEEKLQPMLKVLSRISKRENFAPWKDISSEVYASHPRFEDGLEQMTFGNEGDMKQLWNTWLRSSPSELYVAHHHRQNTSRGPEVIHTSNQFAGLQDAGGSNGELYSEDTSSEAGEGVSHGLETFQPMGIPTVNQHLTRSELQRLEKRDRSVVELLSDINIWKMSRKERQKLHDYWIEMAKSTHKERVKELMGQHEQFQGYLKLQRESLDGTVLKKVKVVGITTTGVAMHQQLIQELQPRIMIVEEAAEVLEAHVLTSMSQFLEHLILIGDHDQLRPKTQLYELREESKTGLNLDISLFERLVSQGQIPYAVLETQRRMRPQFSRLIRETVYPKLKDDRSVFEYPETISGMTETLFFFDHEHLESGEDDSKSKVNPFEAKFSVRLAKYLVQQGCWEKGDIAIITPYVGQLIKIKDEMKACRIQEVLGQKDQELLDNYMEDEDGFSQELGPSGSKISPKHIHNRSGSGFGDKTNTKSLSKQAAVSEVALRDCIRLATIDNFQGEEAKIIILSLTRNNKDGKIGFLGTKNRANVLLSRAKWGQYIIGNSRSLQEYKKSDMWPKVLQILDDTNKIGKELKVQCMRHKENITSIKHWEDFDRFVGDGGCQVTCNEQLPCGHRCPRRCHSDDQNHQAYRCMKETSVKLPCGHFQFKVPCHRADPKLLKCNEEVTVILSGCPFRHQNKVKCNEVENFRKDPKNCREMVQVQLPFCGHEINVQCGKRSEMKCTKMCGLPMEAQCGHECRNICGDCVSATNETYGVDLQEMASMKTATLNDWKSRMVHPACTVKCGKNLLCGHFCKSKCHHSEGPCKPCKQQCEHHCSHSTHKCNKTCSDPCIPCAESCEWECPHRGRCGNPCGAPCTRLPCNKRCEKKLSCGCRCPALCGEPCPKKKYCLEHAPENVKNQDVDIIMMRSFGELTDEDVSNDPLVILKCGHVFQTSTMDGHMEMSEYYEEEEAGSPSSWGKIKPLSPATQRRKVCIMCKVAIHGVFRYGRCINKITLDQLELRLITKCENQLRIKEEKRAQIEERFKATKDELTAEEISSLGFSIRNSMEEFGEIAAKAERTPKVRIHELQEAEMQARLQQANGPQIASVLDEMSSLTPPKPDLSRYCKALLGWVKYEILWLTVNTQHIHKAVTLDISTQTNGENMRKSRQVKNVKKMIKLFDEGYEKAVSRLECVVDVAKRTVSTQSELLAYKLNVHLIVTKFEFFMKSNDQLIAEAFGRSYYDHAEAVRKDQEKLLHDAKRIIQEGLRRARTDSQREELRSLQKSVNQLSPSSFDCREEVLMAILRKDTSLRSENFGSGHIYTCPNGHIYLIGDCGQANQSSHCPDCGEAIGGSSHQLTGGNRAAQEVVQYLRSQRVR